MSDEVSIVGTTMRQCLVIEAEGLRRQIETSRTMAQYLDTEDGRQDPKGVLRLAGVDEAETMAALMWRTVRARRESADALEAFRTALIRAVGRIERARRIAAGEGEE